MLRCREITEVVAEARQLPWWRKPEVWFHLTICGACRLYAKQMQLLKLGAKKLSGKHADLEAEKKLEEEVLKKLNRSS